MAQGDFGSIGFLFVIVIKHHLAKLGLTGFFRQVCEGEHIDVFIVCALAFKTHPAFFIDEPRHEVGEVGFIRLWIFATFNPDGVLMQTPFGTEAHESSIDMCRNAIALSVRDGRQIPAPVIPGRHQRTVFVENNAVIDHCCVIQ